MLRWQKLSAVVVAVEGVEGVRRRGGDLCVVGVVWYLRCVVGAQEANHRGKLAGTHDFP